MRSATEPQNGTTMETVTKTRKPLRGVTKGKIKAAVRIVCYGVDGIGKTSLFAAAEDVIFMCKEGGTEQHDIARLPAPTHWRNAPPDEDGIRRDVFSLVENLRQDDHNFKALAIDSLDWLEPLLFRHLCEVDTTQKDNQGNIVLAYGGFGKGFDVAVTEWRALLAQLDNLRKERGMHILMTAHAHVRTYNNPEGENWDRFQMKMNEKGAGVIKEWADAVLFAHQEIFATNKEAPKNAPVKKKYGIGTMTRHLFTERRPAWDAKNRFGLPEKMALSWPDLIKHIETRSPENIETLIQQAKEQIGFMSPGNQVEAMAAIGRAGQDPEKLAILINWIQGNQDAK
jgi:hypothetical protein